MTIGKKIIGGYIIVLALLALVTGIAFYSLARIQSTYDGFIDVDAQLVSSVDELRFQLRSQVGHYRAILLYPDQQKKYWGDLQNDHRQFAESIDKMRRLMPSAEGLSMVNEIAAMQAQHELGQERAVSLAQQNKRAEALTLGIKEVRPLTDALTDKTARFREMEVKLETAGRAELTATVNFIYLLIGAISSLGLILGLSIGYYLSRSTTRQLRESVAQLAASSAEILATTTQVASGAAETAASVSETTATVEEVKQTAQLASQKARSVSDSAQKASQISQSGRKSVEDTAQGMQRIQEQMESIAESIVQLSEQSQSIGEISPRSTTSPNNLICSR